MNALTGKLHIGCDLFEKKILGKKKLKVIP